MILSKQKPNIDTQIKENISYLINELGINTLKQESLQKTLEVFCSPIGAFNNLEDPNKTLDILNNFKSSLEKVYYNIETINKLLDLSHNLKNSNKNSNDIQTYNEQFAKYKEELNQNNIYIENFIVEYTTFRNNFANNKNTNSYAENIAEVQTNKKNETNETNEKQEFTTSSIEIDKTSSTTNNINEQTNNLPSEKAENIEKDDIATNSNTLESDKIPSPASIECADSNAIPDNIENKEAITAFSNTEPQEFQTYNNSNKRSKKKSKKKNRKRNNRNSATITCENIIEQPIKTESSESTNKSTKSTEKIESEKSTNNLTQQTNLKDSVNIQTKESNFEGTYNEHTQMASSEKNINNQAQSVSSEEPVTQETQCETFKETINEQPQNSSFEKNINTQIQGASSEESFNKQTQGVSLEEPINKNTSQLNLNKVAFNSSSKDISENISDETDNSNFETVVNIENEAVTNINVVLLPNSTSSKVSELYKLPSSNNEVKTENTENNNNVKNVTENNSLQNTNNNILKDASIQEKKSSSNQILEDNNTLLISETKGKVFLPYKVKNLNEILENSKDKYDSLTDIIYDKFVLPIGHFKPSIFSRFKEAFNLMRNKEKSTLFQAISLGVELAKNSLLNPAIIAACSNLDQLDIYLDYLEENQTEKFDIFKIKYEIPPKKPFTI